MISWAQSVPPSKGPVSSTLIAPSLTRVKVNRGKTVRLEVKVPPVGSDWEIVMLPVDAVVVETVARMVHSWEEPFMKVTVIGDTLTRESHQFYRNGGGGGGGRSEDRICQSLNDRVGSPRGVSHERAQGNPLEGYVLSTGTPERQRSWVEEVSGKGCAWIFKGKAGWGDGVEEVIAGRHVRVIGSPLGGAHPLGETTGCLAGCGNTGW